MEKNKSGLATAAMVLGIIAVVGSWIPLLNVVSIILAVLAIIFGLIPLFQKKSLGKAISGLALGIITIIIAISMNNAAVENIDVAINEGDSSEIRPDDDSEPAQTSFNIGEAIDFDNKKVTVLDVSRNWSSGNEFITPDSGNEYVRVNVEIQNNSDNQISYNTLDWKLKDSSGVIKNVDVMAFGDGGLDSGELAGQGKVSGDLVFQAPDGDDGLVLVYEPSFWSNRKLEIKL